jgi:hypothetical protein
MPVVKQREKERKKYEKSFKKVRLILNIPGRFGIITIALKRADF